MTLCQAYNNINNRGITPWMAYAIIKWNAEFIIYNSDQLRRFPDLDYVYIRKGEGFPNSPVGRFEEIKIN